MRSGVMGQKKTSLRVRVRVRVRQHPPRYLLPIGIGDLSLLYHGIWL